MGTANDSAASAAKQSNQPSKARLRRTRNGSARHRKTDTGIVTATASASFKTRPGLTQMKNRKVAESMTIRSTNVAVIMSTLCLNCDNTTRMTMSMSESAADVSGRRSRISQKRLSRPQVRMKAARAASSASDQSNMPKATR